MNDPLAAIPTRPALSILSSNRVPNERPTSSTSYRLAIIGEAPGVDEDSHGRPFIGASGRLLDSMLGSAGVDRTACFVGNVCQHRPPNNDLDAWPEDHPHRVEGIITLREELKEFQPHCTLVLGTHALRFARGPGFSIDDWRGSIMASSIGKIVPAYHPAFVLRNYKTWPLLRFDIARARVEAEDPDLKLPQRSFDLDVSADEIVRRLTSWPSGHLASIDIEGGLNGWTCIGVASASNHAFIIAFGLYTETEQARIYRALSLWLYRDDVPKVLQNSLYDRFVLFYGFRMLVRAVVDDTMLKSAEIYPELPKGLDTAASIWTREPQWKHLIAYSKVEQKRRAKAGVSPVTEMRNKHHACCIDCAVTYEINDAQSSALHDGNLRHYRENVSLLSPLLYMEMRGFNYNSALAQEELARVRVELSECATRLEVRAGYSLTGTKGGLSALKKKRFLYEDNAYPVQYNGRGPDKKVTTDIGALLTLAKKLPNDPTIADLLLHSRLESIKETLEISTDPDGRVRCAYNLVGTETMRLTCYTSPTGSGANLQTITKPLRRLYRADPDHFIFQCDLAGADGWTVAARCKFHGDPTMWDDYVFGLKPAKILALMLKHGGVVNSWSRDEIKAASRSVDGDSAEYFVCKVVQHGSNYGMQETMMQKNVMEKSYKITGRPLYVTPQFCTQIQQYYFYRYPGLYQWHEWAKREVFEGRNLTSASGHTRVFFGRRRSYNNRSKQVEVDHETWKEFLADEPQENTTYVTNRALHKLWNDPENRVQTVRRNSRMELENLRNEERSSNVQPTTRLIVEPIHTVHDALVGQFHISDLEFAKRKIPEWFHNPIIIAGQEVIIPYEGAYGPSWGEQGEKYGGGTI